MGSREIKQNRAYETRARILNGAAESFAANGFSGATISDIMTRAGVTKGALYFHFDTKEEIADAVLAAHEQWLLTAVDAQSGTPAQRLIDLSYLACEGLAEDPIFQATARLAVERETYGPGRPASFGMWAEVTGRLLEEIQEAGQLRTRVDPRVMGRMLSAGMLGMHLSARAADPDARLHREVDDFWAYVGSSFVSDEALGSVRLRPAS